MANCKQLHLILLGVVLASSAQAQTNFLNIGPTLTVSTNSKEEKGRKGLGGSIEYFRQLSLSGGMRFYTGIEKFHTPGRSNDIVTYIPFRAGYQQYLFDDKFFLSADAGIALLRFSPQNHYDLFTFSAGGGYHLYLDRNKYIQFQAFYVYTQNKDPFNEDAHYGWGTFRIAYGIGFGGAMVPPNPKF